MLQALYFIPLLCDYTKRRWRPAAGGGADPEHHCGVRATVLSLAGQADAIGQGAEVAGGPLGGAVGTALSLRAPLVASGLLLSPALLLAARTL